MLASLVEAWREGGRSGANDVGEDATGTLLPLEAERPQPVNVGNTAGECRQRLPDVWRGVADQQRTGRCIVDVGHRVEDVGGDAFLHTEVIHVAHHHPHVLPHLRLGQDKGAADGASDVDPTKAQVGLPLEGELRVAQAVGIDDGCRVGRQCLVLHQQPGHGRASTRRAVRRRVDDFQRALGVLIHRANADAQAGHVVRDLVGSARRPLHLPCGNEGDVFVNPRTRQRFDLPVVSYRTVDCTGRVGRTDVVRIAHGQRCYTQQLTTDGGIVTQTGGRIENRQVPRRAGVHGSAHTRRLRAVRELQPLDTGQAVDTITPGHQVGDDHRVAIDHHAVVGGHPREHRRVIAVGAIEDFPDDHQLARVVGAIEHQRHHRLHAVETGDFRAGAVAVGAHADAHVQPLVTVEDVIATTAFDQVAAAAAEDDVAAIVERRPGSQQAGQAVDQVDVGQHAARGAIGRQAGGVFVVTAQEVAMGRAGKAFHDVEAHQRRRARARYRRHIEEAVAVVDGHALGQVLEGRPVVAGAADIAVAEAQAADHDVVAAFTVELVVLVAADEHVVADDRVVAEWVEVVARRTVRGALLDPVVAFVTHILFVGLAAQDKVVALAANGFGSVLTGDDEVVAETADDQVDAITAVQHIVAVAALDVVVTAHVADDVVAGATAQLVVAVATLDAVVAAIAPDRVVTLAGHQDVVTVGAAQHDVLGTGIADVVGVRANRQRAVAEHYLLAVLAERVGIAQAVVVLLALVQFQVEARVGEHQARQVGGRGVGHDQLGERVALQLGVHRQARGALQVVEAVTVLQFLHLVFEHEVEGTAEHAAERGFRLGQAADPQVDGIDTGHGHSLQVIGRTQHAILARQGHIGPGTTAVEEVQAIGRRTIAAEHQGHGRSAFFEQGGGTGDAAVGAVSRDEVDQRLGVLQVLHQVDPAGVRFELGVAGLPEDVAAHSVQRGDADIPATGDVDRRQVERQAKQVVAQRLGDELVDFVTGLASNPAHDGAGGILGGDATGGIRQRVEERRDQAQLLFGVGAGRVLDDVEVDVKAVDSLGQHRVAKAVHGVGELGHD